MEKQQTSSRHTGPDSICLTISRCNKKIDAIYIKLSDGEIVKSKEIADGDLVVDLDKRGKVVGIEILEPVTLKISKKLQKDTPALAGVNINALQNAFQFV